jgi:hypothetical protein
VIVRNNLLNLSPATTEYALYVIYLQQPWVDDVGSVSHPWIIILMSTSIRNAALPFLKNIFKKKKTEVSVLSITNVQAAVTVQSIRWVPHRSGY